MYRALIITTAGLMTASCASLAPPPQQPTPPPVPAALLTPCEPPQQPMGNLKSDLLRAYINTSTRLNRCKARHDALIRREQARQRIEHTP